MAWNQIKLVRETKENQSPFSAEPRPFFFLTITALIWFYLFVWALNLKVLVDWANLWGPVTLGLVTGWSGFLLIRSKPITVWSPYAWALLTIVLFYSIGPLVYTLGNPQVVGYVNSFLPISSLDLLHTNLLDAVGIFSLLCGFYLTRNWGWKNQNLQPMKRVQPNLRAVALVFLVTGGALEYVLVLPDELGIIHTVVPGVILNIGELYLMGLLIWGFLIARGSHELLFRFVLLWLIQIVLTFLTFNKGVFFFSLLLPFLGIYMGCPKLGYLLLFSVFAIGIYFVTARFSYWARIELAKQKEVSGLVKNLFVRSKITIDYFVESNHFSGVQENTSNAAISWGRLNYANVQSFAMSRYDSGLPGHTLKDTGIILIPRFFWPEKPKITNQGTDFYYLVSGRHGTSLGLGIFGEGYWDYGWWGVLGLSFVTGMFFALLGNLSLGWIARSEFEYLPSVFTGISVGFGALPGLFVTSVIGASGFFLLYALLVWLVLNLVPRFRLTGAR